MAFAVPARLLIVLLALAGLSGCAGPEKQSCKPDGPLLPMPDMSLREPDDSVLLEAVREYVGSRGAPLNSRFEYTRIDLNEDGRRDALVYLNMPYNYWCGQHGCTMLILRAGNDYFETVSRLEPVRPPMTVSRKATNGWRDLLVRIDGRRSKTRDVALQYAGGTYPANPARVPAIPYDYPAGGTVVFP